MLNSIKRIVLVGLAATLGVSCTHKTDKKSTVGKENQLPNIVYVLADDLGYGDISALNENGKIKTPNIDQMASEGMRFTDAHTSSSVCTPTRYGILTGRYNWRSKLKKGVLGGTSKALIPTSRSTVASVLKKNGYHTAFIGKWHLGWDWGLKKTEEFGGGWDEFDKIDYSKPVTNTPNDLGFDYAYGHCGSLDMAPYVYVENGLATQIPGTVTVNTGKYSWWRKGPTSNDFIHEDVTPNFFRRGIQYIREQANRDEPFFLYLPLPSPHTPILPTEQWQGKSGLNPYGDFVMMVDDYMGQLLEAVKESGIEENTLIIFTSDNGCSPAAKINELEAKGHSPSYIYRGHKADIFEGGHRVPFIAKWPKKINKGMVSDETICTTDLMATCAEIIGYSMLDNEGEDSYSLVALFEQEKLDKPLREATVHHSINGNFAIRKGEWKLIMCPGSGGWSFPRPGKDDGIRKNLPPIQLYNLRDDPGETKNLHTTHTAKAKELKSLLMKYIVEGRSTPGVPQKNDSIDFKWEQVSFMNQ
ncbi:arylsulfatase [Muricauda sp. SCSIO 64092]|uniref:sulfatase family protein n=1 Tax=Allomuricauda sp. SCSIO 64092 TaxID=2908842 RepID=UPI001FF3EB2C|nr:arylsulfatase [Muricauda sp. SCSIO 64092]UOY04940.1 arylsulfatase [Muricauda sp. SCSIO 64092]